jgi:hypothetical protein
METSEPVNFNYDVKIGHGADILKTGPLGQGLANCGEIVITSKPFSNYADCEKTLSSLMSALSFIETKFSAQGHVIVNKLNPLLDTSGKKHSDADQWDKFTIMRSYVANADELKKSTLNYHVLGQIRVDQMIVAFTPTPQPPPLSPIAQTQIDLK